MQICGDYKVTINRVAKLDPYSLTKTEDFYPSIEGGTAFSKLDLSFIYQLILDGKPEILLTTNTPHGLFRYTCLPFGVSSAPALFQWFMERILQGIPNCLVSLDDTLISGVNQESH